MQPIRSSKRYYLTALASTLALISVASSAWAKETEFQNEEISTVSQIEVKADLPASEPVDASTAPVFRPTATPTATPTAAPIFAPQLQLTQATPTVDKLAISPEAPSIPRFTPIHLATNDLPGEALNLSAPGVETTIPTFSSSVINNAQPEAIAQTTEPDPLSTAVPSAEAAPTTSTAPDIPTPALSQAVSSDQVQILNPTAGSVLDVPATTVIVKFPVGADVELRVNDRAVDSDLIGRTETDPETNLITQTWYGVALEEGSNTLTMVRRSDEGVLQSVEVEVRGAPIEMRLTPQSSGIPADGRSTGTIQGQLLDELGNASNWEAIVTLIASDGEFVGVDYAPDQPGFQVQAQNGQFTAELRSSLEARVVQLQAVANNLEAFNQVQFVTPQRPSIATGIVDLRLGARGTDFRSSLRDFLPTDGDNDYEIDLDASLFTMGNIGEWLLTGAYNSDRPLNEDCRGETTLFRQSSGSCSNLYPVYGDDSTLDVTAPSTDHLYLRLERTSPVEGAGTDYAMWGDYNTEEFANPSQFFTATSRQLHGFKFNYNLGNLALTGLYGDNVEGFQRDTLAPDGTSGLYFLSRRLVIPGSEEIYIEAEELNRPGTVVARQQLFRGTDYDVDYDRGTILFNDPILQTSIGDFGEVLVRRIVATYQYEGENTDTNILAGRLQYNFDRTLNQESWLGASYLLENQGSRNFELFGADALISLGDSAQIVAEVAHSESDFELSGPVSGSAYRVELDGEVDDWLTGRAYWRSTDAGFTNAATTSFVPGQTRYGAQANARLSGNTTLRAQYDHEDNFGTAPRPLTSLSDLLEPGSSPVPGSRVDNSLTTYSLGISQRLGDSNLEFDWIHRDRSDRTNPEIFDVSSDQLRTRLTTRLSNDITFRAQNELTLSSDSDPIYPSRTVFGVDWQLMPGITLGVNQIFYGGDGLSNSDALTTIDLTGEHSLGEDTTLRGRFSSIEGQQLGGAIGIEHGFNLGPGLRLDLGYEHTFNSLLGRTASGTQFRQPFAVGTGGSALSTTNGNTYTAGLSYTDNPDLQASARFEHRTSSQGSNTLLDASVVGRLSPAVSALLNYQLTRAANQEITGIGTTSNLKLGLAYRDPNDDRFNALLRYEHRINPGTLPTNALFGRSIDTAEHLFSAEAIYAPNWQWEFYGKYAFRRSTTRISQPGDDFVSSNNLHLAQIRATYRFDYHWDITGEARWFGGLGDYSEVGYSLEAGYYPTPDLRLYAGYSGGGAYDDDFGINRSASGFYLGVSAKINNLFNGFGLQDVAPPQQRESEIEADAATEATIDTATDEPTEATETAESLETDG
ncbi:MAG: TonB-dependent receptor [Cyanobacteria bacterium P01_G01_bin.38]